MIVDQIACVGHGDQISDLHAIRARRKYHGSDVDAICQKKKNNFMQ